MIDKIYKRLIMQENKTKEERIDSIIRNHMVWSMGAGLIPVPIADFFAVSAIQLDMIRQIAKIYDIDFSEQAGKASITSLTSSGLARLGARAVKFLPGVGTILGGITMSVLSGASSYALGQVFSKHFATGGTFLDFEPSRVRKFYNEQFEKGKIIAKEIKEEEGVPEDVVEQITEKPAGKATQPLSNTKSKSIAAPDHNPENPLQKEAMKDPLPDEDDPISKILKLSEMKDNGIITDEEFATLKRQIIG
jgi:uncharacterized protein (DUF697 family)